eukprot:8488998-Pyramimonas_sp.AAC.1
MMVIMMLMLVMMRMLGCTLAIAGRWSECLPAYLFTHVSSIRAVVCCVPDLAESCRMCTCTPDV